MVITINGNDNNIDIDFAMIVVLVMGLFNLQIPRATAWFRFKHCFN